MLNFSVKKDPKTGKKILETSISGKLLLTTPQLNKGTAFTEQERHDFGLLGKLPSAIEELDDQVKRVYEQFSSFHTPLQKNIFLRSLHETNEILFYKLVCGHIAEMIPILYTPIVGTSVKQFSLEFRRPRGLFISYPDRHKMAEILANRSHPNIELIVTSDGEGVLGIGDQGIGGMDIPIAKLMVYSIVGGMPPYKTLPIMLDVGTNNQKLLDDPMYLGWRHPRIEGPEYDAFIAEFVDTVKKTFPNVFLHWEDFGRRNARANLDTYREKILSFNDDIQGTGVVSLAAVLAGINAAGSTIRDQRVVVFGAGSAGVGIASQICSAMIQSGLTEEQARSNFWLLSSSGLLTDNSNDLSEDRKRFARPHTEVKDWTLEQEGMIHLFDVVKNVKPTILIGTSTSAGAFNEAIIREMAQHVERPIIFPLSNPTEHSEAHPRNLIAWTKGKALIATGSPFDPVEYEGHKIPIAQCNNALVFPGIGLGSIAVKAKYCSDEMLWVACNVVAKHSPILKDPQAALLPSINDCQWLSREIAIAVAQQAVDQGLAQIEENNIEQLVDDLQWTPKYLEYKKVD